MGTKRTSHSGSWVVISVGILFVGLGVLGMWWGSHGLLPEPMSRPPGGFVFVGAGLVLYGGITLVSKRDGFAGKRQEEDS